MTYFIPLNGRLKLSETNMWKKPHYLIEQFLAILTCNLISQNTIFHKARWMLTNDPLVKFPLVHEVIVHRLLEMILTFLSLPKFQSGNS